MRFLKLLAVLALLGAAGWQGAQFYRAALASNQKVVQIPTAQVKRGDLPLTLASYGTLEAANTYSLRNRGSETGTRGVEASLRPAATSTPEVSGSGSGGGGGRSRGGDGGGRSFGGGGGPGGGGRSFGGGRGEGGGGRGEGGGGRGSGGGLTTASTGSGASGAATATSAGGSTTAAGGTSTAASSTATSSSSGRGGESGGRSFSGFSGRGGGRGDQGVEAQIVDIIEDGLVVDKGQIVVRLDKTKIERQLRDRKLAYENALASLKRVEADATLNVKNSATRMKKAEMEQSFLLSNSKSDIEQAQAEVKYNGGELDYRKRTFERTERLAKDLLVPATDVERDELNVKRSEFQKTSGERQLASKESSQKSAISQGELVISDAKYAAVTAENKAQAAVENARYNVEAAKYLYELSQKQLEWCDVKAPMAGLVVIQREWDRSGGTPRMLQPGDLVRPNSQLMQIIDLSRMRVTADVGEMDASQIQVGQAVRVWPRSASDQVLKGRVLSVSKLARQGDMWRRNAIPGKKTFRVVIEIQESRPEVLRPGLTADFEIQQGRLPNVLRVPLQALFKTEKGTSVFVRRGERFVVRPIKIGQRNANFAQVLSGLKEGEEVAVRRPPLKLLGEPVAKPEQRVDLFRRLTGMVSKT